MICRSLWQLSIFIIVYSRAIQSRDPIADTLSDSIIRITSDEYDEDILLQGRSSFIQGWGGDINTYGDSYLPLQYNKTSPIGLDGCKPVKNPVKAQSSQAVILVNRGNCTFADKAYNAQQAGATAIFITDTLDEVMKRTFSIDPNDEDIKEELAVIYDCDNGQAPSLSKIEECENSSQCTSQQCIPISKNKKDGKHCCIWDLPDGMGYGLSSKDLSHVKITIPVLRLTIEDGNALKSILVNATTPPMARISPKFFSSADPSQLALWILAISVVVLGGYKGAFEERQDAIIRTTTLPTTLSVTERHMSALPPGRRSLIAMMTVDPPQVNEQEINHVVVLENEQEKETVELTVWHALAFICMGSAVLLVMFYFNVVLVVIVGFTIASIQTTYLLVFYPIFKRTPWLRDQCIDLGILSFSLCKFLSLVCAGIVAVMWFILRHQTGAWLVQNAFAMLMCVMFLETLRIPNLRIATVLLVTVFVYDIFMVFVTPLIFNGESVMVKAATGGAQQQPSVGSESYCIRYPKDSDMHCLRETMPLLLQFPRLWDFRGGVSMLGLGDIVLPGLLLVFAARYDYATRGYVFGSGVASTINRMRWINANRQMEASQNVENSCPPQTNAAEGNVQINYEGQKKKPSHSDSRWGLFALLIIGYAVGLLMANAAVIIMKQGQPALLYLVPSTLGTAVVISYRRGIFQDLWCGPAEFADVNDNVSLNGIPNDGSANTDDDHNYVVSASADVDSDKSPNSTQFIQSNS